MGSERDIDERKFPVRESGVRTAVRMVIVPGSGRDV